MLLAAHADAAPSAWVRRFAGLIRPGGTVLDLWNLRKKGALIEQGVLKHPFEELVVRRRQRVAEWLKDEPAETVARFVSRVDEALCTGCQNCVLAIKDEFEVARLYTSAAFQRELRQQGVKDVLRRRSLGADIAAGCGQLAAQG